VRRSRQRCSVVDVGKLTRVILVCAAVTALSVAAAAAGENEAAAREILVLERKALDGWQAGNPDPCLALLDPEVTYFHVVTGERLDGLPAVKALFESYRGKSLFDSYEMAGPKVQGTGDTVVLTYILVRHVGGEITRWNSTQIYQRKKEGWRVVHSHWSATAT
jgi:hypothetical protein